MKTAETWIREMGVEVDTGHLPPQTQLTMSAIIKKIQLDAWKDGVTHAAMIIANRPAPDYVGMLLNDRDSWTER